MSSSRSSSGSVASSWASRWISRSNTSRCVRMEMYSPPAIENAPARSPAMPATTMILLSTAAPVTPMISERFDTSPSLIPKMAAGDGGVALLGDRPAVWADDLGARPQESSKHERISSSLPFRAAVVAEELLDLGGQTLPRRDVGQRRLPPGGLLETPDVVGEGLVLFDQRADLLFPRGDGGL